MKDARDWFRYQQEQGYDDTEQLLAEQLQAHIEALQEHPDRFTHSAAPDAAVRSPEAQNSVSGNTSGLDTTGWSPNPGTRRRSDWDFDVPERDIKDVALKRVRSKSSRRRLPTRRWRKVAVREHSRPPSRRPEPFRVRRFTNRPVQLPRVPTPAGDAVTIAAQVAGLVPQRVVAHHRPKPPTDQHRRQVAHPARPEQRGHLMATQPDLDIITGTGSGTRYRAG